MANAGGSGQHRRRFPAPPRGCGSRLLKRPAHLFKEDFGPLDYRALAGIRFSESDAAARAMIRLKRRQAETPERPCQAHPLLAIRTAWIAGPLHFVTIVGRLTGALICINGTNRFYMRS
jgi:hypothetical protein